VERVYAVLTTPSPTDFQNLSLTDSLDGSQFSDPNAAPFVDLDYPNTGASERFLILSVWPVPSNGTNLAGSFSLLPDITIATTLSWTWNCHCTP